MDNKILSRVRVWLSSCDLEIGSRIPPERNLASSLGISRADLRKAFLVLEAEGRLERKVGLGTFLVDAKITPAGNSALDTIAALAERTGPIEAMNARLALEPEIARLAAHNATPRQLADLRKLSTLLRNSSSWNEYEKLDHEFHDLIAESGGNKLLHDLHKIINGVRMIVVWRRLSPQDSVPMADYHSFDEHDLIVNALEHRDRDGAQKAMRTHLKMTLAIMTAEE